jgi:hypothetical protein
MAEDERADRLVGEVEVDVRLTVRSVDFEQRHRR